jgi:tripartite-type tricarboxylate transporter receptor subunit TctC
MEANARLRIGSAALVAAALVACAPAIAWEPTRPVEIIVPAGAGGATDQMARVIQSIVGKHKLMKSSMIVQLKGGSSGAEGIMDLKASAGDPNKFLIASSAIYTLPLGTDLPFNWRDLTPVALVALDEFIFWVNADTPYKTPKEYLAAVKAAPEKFKMGGTGSKREDHIITAAIEKSQGVKFTYIPYKSGGEISTQLVGKHIDSDVNNPSESVAHWRAGQVRTLCVFDEQRMPFKAKVTADQSWGDIPTCKETGVDVQYLMLRGIFMAPGVTPDQVAFFVDLFRKIVATPEWKEYVETNALKDTFVIGAEFQKFLENDEARHKQLMVEAGFATVKK